MKLYSTDNSPFAARVRLAAAWKGIALHEALPPDGPGSAAFRAITPTGKVPALEVHGQVIAESEVIVEYLEDEFPTPSLRPDSHLDRARARLLARLADLYLAEPLRELFEHAKAGADGEAVRTTATRVRRALALLDHAVGDQGYAVGDRPSTADCALVPLLFFLVRCAGVLERADGLGLWHEIPRLASYWSAVQQDAVVRRVLEDMDAVQQRRAIERAVHGRNAII